MSYFHLYSSVACVPLESTSAHNMYLFNLGIANNILNNKEIKRTALLALTSVKSNHLFDQYLTFGTDVVHSGY